MTKQHIGILLKTRILISCCFIGLLFFFEEGCYASQSEPKENVRVSSVNFTVRGRVIDVYGEPLIGATIREKGGANGTVTDVEGNFFLSVPDSAILQISFVGYESQEVGVQGRSMLEICLKESIQLLDHVIVTALGLEKKESSLAYAVQKVRGGELNRVKEVNMITALAGKAAGVQVSKNSSGMGGSAKVSIRGVRSVAGDNQPLYVIDGVPMSNSTSEQAYSAIGGTANAGNRDGGDGISNLNPEDVESISILKGAPAAALYGSQAANGVILITTKKGNSVGRRDIHFSTGLTFEKAFCLPKMQNNYGVSDVTDSWGEKENLMAYDNLNNFFRTGLTSITSVSVNSGNDRLQTYFSYANTTGRGILNENKLSKHNINLRETAVLFNSLLKLDGNVNVMRQTVKNKPVSGGFYMNPLVGLYRFPRGEDLSYYKDNYEHYDEERKLNTQNWHTFTEDFEQNPYWIQNRIQSKEARTRLILSLSANLKVTGWLTLQARGNMDYSADKLRQKFYASTATALCGMNGRYIEMDYQETLMYGDVMAMAKKKLNDFTLNIAIGGSINDKVVNSTRIDSKNASLKFANVFNLANIVMSSSASIDQKIDAHYQLQSVFATAQAGYKEGAFLDLTARNDWSSTLAHTDSKNTGFFYPSIGATWILNKTCSLPKWISFAKVRASWAEVGNDLPIGITNPVDIIMVGGSINVNTVEQRGDLKPEISSSIEFGTEWRFFHHRFGIDFTWYQTNTKNQLLRMDNPTGSTYKYRYVNAGKIRNQGFELTVDATPLLYRNFSWKSLINMSANKNKVVTLHPDYPEFSYYEEGFNAGYQMRVKEGGSLGDIYGNAFRRNEDGSIMVDETSKRPLGNTGNKDLLGNANPDFTMGWSNTLTYKDLELYFLIDFRFGGEVMSLTQSELDANGVTKVTEDARARGYVEYQGQKFNDPRAFYSAVGGRNAISEYYMYDATCIRLREVSLSYSFPKTILENSRFIKGIDVSLAARNLCFLKKEAPFDPDAVMSVGNNNQGVDVFGMPTTRNIGFNLRLTF